MDEAANLIVNSLAFAGENLAWRRCKTLNSRQIDDLAELGQPVGNERRQRVEPLLLAAIVRRQFAQPTRLDVDVLGRLPVGFEIALLASDDVPSLRGLGVG